MEGAASRPPPQPGQGSAAWAAPLAPRWDSRLGKRRGRRTVRWLVTVCMLVAVAGLVTSARARSQATKQVTYHGYKVEVPTSWPVVDLARNPSACVRFDVHAVYLGHPGADPSCPAKLVGRTEALLVEPIDRTSKARVGGHRRGAGPGRRGGRGVQRGPAGDRRRQHHLLRHGGLLH